MEAGANVTLVAGPVAQTLPAHVRIVNVITAKQMHDSVMSEVKEHNIFIATAAVSDYRCVQQPEQKIKKTKQDISLKLTRNPDILAEVATLADAPFTIGFAAETEALEENARLKLRDKNLDLIAANQVGDDVGFDSEDNALDLYWDNGKISLELSSKDKIARTKK